MKKHILSIVLITQFIFCCIFLPKYFTQLSEEALQKEITNDKKQLLSKFYKIFGKEIFSEENYVTMDGLFKEHDVKGEYFAPNKSSHTIRWFDTPGRLFDYNFSNSFEINNYGNKRGVNKYFDYIFEPYGFPIKDLGANLSLIKKDSSIIEIHTGGFEYGDIGFERNFTKNPQFISLVYEKLFSQIFSSNEFDLKDNRYDKFKLLKIILNTQFFIGKSDELVSKAQAPSPISVTFNGLNYNLQIARKQVSQNITYVLSKDKIEYRRREINDSNKIFWKIIILINGIFLLVGISFNYLKR